MPFCKLSVQYPACVPKAQFLPPSREYPDGRWFNHTIQKKDAWVAEQYEIHVTEREILERNKTLRKARINEYGDEGKIEERFYKSSDCQFAYRNYFCWINFPRCDFKRDLTFPTCKSACENYFISCKFEADLWRCGKSKWFNGNEPESPSIDPISQELTYKRDYFPGQPFRANKFSLKGNDLVVCTPSIQGSAYSNTHLGYQAVLSSIAIVYLSFAFFV